MSAPTDSRRLNVAIIVRDAAEAIRETLSSIHKIADEIVVVDTGSSDSTLDVLAEFGVKLVKHEWADDFSAARNAALEELTGDWVLWLDAGERLSATDAQQLKEFVSQNAESDKAYVMLVQIPPTVPGAAGEQVGRVRLAPGRSEIRFQGRVRESLDASLAEKKIEMEGLPFRIQRGIREHDPRTKTQKARRNIRLAEQDIREQGPLPHLLNCLGDAFQTLQDDERAIQCFRHALAASQSGSIEMLEAYYGLVTSLASDDEKRDERLTLCVEALEVFPMDAQLLCAMGGLLQAQGRIDLARKSYQTAYQYGQVNPAMWHVTEFREIAAICWSLALQVQKRDQEAQATLEEALSESADSLRLRRHLMEFHIRNGRRDEALVHVDKLPYAEANREAWRSAVRGACLAAEGNWPVAKAYLNTAYTAGCRDTLLLRWLAVTLLAGGEIQDARPVLEEWRTSDPTNPEAARYLQAIAQRADTSTEDGRRLRIDTAQSPGASAPTVQGVHGLPPAKSSHAADA